MGFICFLRHKEVVSCLIAARLGEGSMGMSDETVGVQLSIWGSWFSCPHPGLHQPCPSCHRTHPTHTSVSNCLLLPWWGGLPPHSTGTWGGKNNWFGVTFFVFICDSPIRACDSHSYTREFLPVTQAKLNQTYFMTLVFPSPL